MTGHKARGSKNTGIVAERETVFLFQEKDDEEGQDENRGQGARNEGIPGRRDDRTKENKL